MHQTLRLILGDQLNYEHSWYKKVDSSITYVLMEVLSEQSYVTHHIQKITAFFSAMRAFAKHLHNSGHTVIYFKLDSPNNLQSFQENIKQLVLNHSFTHFEWQEPDEYRLEVSLSELATELEKTHHIIAKKFSTEHFLSERNDLEKIFTGNKKNYLLETFYRFFRRKYSILMDGDKPLGERWNFDAENRKKIPPSIPIPKPLEFKHDVSDIVQTLTAKNVAFFGSLPQETTFFPSTPHEANLILEHFTRHLLPYFGMYQDAMTHRSDTLFHSMLSFAMNVKLLSPLHVIRHAITAWENNPEKISLSQIEGFVRQILGWREFIRCVYWAEMPAYSSLNFFESDRPLPSWFWNGETTMNCVRHALRTSLDNAYAHHIQRLMIIGNCAQLLGVHPDEVDAWYLGVYADAIEWVQLPNTRGMSQFADGGIIGSKPYNSTANYIDKMSDYCSNCTYNKSLRHGANSCPFNSLYWSFYIQHEHRLRNNHRLGMVYKNIDKFSVEEKQKILAQADYYKSNSENL